MLEFTDVCLITDNVPALASFYEKLFEVTAQGDEIHSFIAVPCLGMYQAVAEKLVKSGVSSHAVALYAHDEQAEKAFFTYGFGLRCMDAVRPVEAIPGTTACLYEIRMLEEREIPLLRSMRRLLSDHLSKSPCFMYSSSESFNECWFVRKADVLSCLRHFRAMRRLHL